MATQHSITERAEFPKRPTMNDKNLQSLRRRLEKWELSHLRKLAAELHERLERAEEARRLAEDDTTALGKALSSGARTQ